MKKSIKKFANKEVKKANTVKGGNQLRGFGSWSSGTNR